MSNAHYTRYIFLNFRFSKNSQI